MSPAVQLGTTTLVEKVFSLSARNEERGIEWG
jgi:hypothetical protein